MSSFSTNTVTQMSNYIGNGQDLFVKSIEIDLRQNTYNSEKGQMLENMLGVLKSTVPSIRMTIKTRSSGYTEQLAKILKSGQCPEGLILHMGMLTMEDTKLLAEALKSNQCPQRLKLHIEFQTFSSQAMDIIISAIGESTSVIKLEHNYQLTGIQQQELAFYLKRNQLLTMSGPSLLHTTALRFWQDQRFKSRLVLARNSFGGPGNYLALDIEHVLPDTSNITHASPQVRTLIKEIKDAVKKGDIREKHLLPKFYQKDMLNEEQAVKSQQGRKR